MPGNIMFVNDVAQSDNKTIAGIACIGNSPSDLAERCMLCVFPYKIQMVPENHADDEWARLNL
jgi:hypothetical protein